jgi:Skp family chaperone for outer membrane proteins
MNRNALRYILVSAIVACVVLLDAAAPKEKPTGRLTEAKKELGTTTTKELPGMVKETEKAIAPTLAYVNIQKIITLDKNLLSRASDEWRNLYNKLQETLEPANKEIAKLEEAFEKGKSEFEQMQDSMKKGLVGQEALKRKYEDVGRLEYELRLRFQERETFAQNELNKAQAQVGPKLDKVVNEVRKARGLDMIIRAEVVLSAADDPRFDITDDVLAKLNKDYAQEQKLKKEAQAKTEKEAAKVSVDSE